MYALAAEQCVAQARAQKQDVIAIVTSAIEVGGASFTRGMRPTYPFITDAEGRMVEMRDMPIPDTSTSYSGDVRGKVFRPMIRFLDHRETRPVGDVSRILASVYKGYGEGGDDAYQATIEKAASLVQQVLDKSANGTISLLDADARTSAKESRGEHFIEAEQFSSWLAHHPDLQQAYEELEAANAGYNAKESGA